MGRIYAHGGSVVVTWIVMLVLVLACRFMTAHLEVHPTKKRQVIAEWIVTSTRDMVQTNMGEKYAQGHLWYVPFIGAMFALSAGCSLSSVVGAYAPTSDLSTVLGWALFVFALITITKIKTNGFGGYLLSFTTPIPVMTPFNIIGEIATPRVDGLPSLRQHRQRQRHHGADLRRPCPRCPAWCWGFCRARLAMSFLRFRFLISAFRPSCRCTSISSPACFRPLSSAC